MNAQPHAEKICPQTDVHTPATDNISRNKQTRTQRFRNSPEGIIKSGPAKRPSKGQLLGEE